MQNTFLYAGSYLSGVVNCSAGGEGSTGSCCKSSNIKGPVYVAIGTVVPNRRQVWRENTAPSYHIIVYNKVMPHLPCRMNKVIASDPTYSVSCYFANFKLGFTSLILV